MCGQVGGGGEEICRHVPRKFFSSSQFQRNPKSLVFFQSINFLCLKFTVIDPHHFDADPDAYLDLTYHFDADPDTDPDPDFYLMRIRKQFRMRIRILFFLDANATTDPSGSGFGSCFIVRIRIWPKW
jgi:hypothetical protein